MQCISVDFCGAGAVARHVIKEEGGRRHADWGQRVQLGAPADFLRPRVQALQAASCFLPRIGAFDIQRRGHCICLYILV